MGFRCGGGPGKGRLDDAGKGAEPKFEARGRPAKHKRVRAGRHGNNGRTGGPERIARDNAGPAGAVCLHDRVFEGSLEQHEQAMVEKVVELQQQWSTSSCGGGVQNNNEVFWNWLALELAVAEYAVSNESIQPGCLLAILFSVFVPSMSKESACSDMRRVVVPTWVYLIAAATVYANELVK
mmetsp:Transcript_13871/g.32051  ORF Transcript_13871/g.32051 Transcript_13871/m.32051 type:complete len:181 (+) Transcript_13871:756-1298(+)